MEHWQTAERLGSSRTRPSLAFGQCPACGKKLDAHATAGGSDLDEPVKLGDRAICIGCGKPLILVGLPYEVRAMSRKEYLELDPGTRALIDRAQEKILLKAWTP